MHGQNRLAVIQKYFQVRTSTMLEGGTLFSQPTFEFIRVHGMNVKHLCCVCRVQGPSATANYEFLEFRVPDEVFSLGAGQEAVRMEVVEDEHRKDGGDE